MQKGNKKVQYSMCGLVVPGKLAEILKQKILNGRPEKKKLALESLIKQA